MLSISEIKIQSEDFHMQCKLNILQIIAQDENNSFHKFYCFEIVLRAMQMIRKERNIN